MGVWLLLLVGATVVCCIWFVMSLLIAGWFVFACCRVLMLLLYVGLVFVAYD